MFQLDGTRTLESLAAEAVLRGCGLPVDPAADDSFALTLYRKDHMEDPQNPYMYLTAMAGVRGPEPMFGPVTWNDYRQKSARRGVNPLGFAARERTFLLADVERDHWHLYVNGRGNREAAEAAFGRVRDTLLDDVDRVIGRAAPAARPLYPDLWYKERIARDVLRNKVRSVLPGTSLEFVARHITEALREVIKPWFQNGAHPAVGIYLDTGREWTLCGANYLYDPWLPAAVPVTGNHQRNAFGWVWAATKALLLLPDRNPGCREWVRDCRKDKLDPLGRDRCGMCIVPITHLHEPWRCMGIMLLTVYDDAPNPAHCYLLNRLAMEVSAYLIPLFPVPGFRWIPNAPIGRGEATLANIRELADEVSVPARVDSVRKAVELLMPTRADVTAHPLASGQSGADVYRLTVTSANRGLEIPRVLKLGRASVIEEELRRYYMHVSNRKVGGAARLDFARELPLDGDGPTDDAASATREAALVYTLVGAGDRAAPWSQWAAAASHTQLKHGLRLLWDQLEGWYSTRAPLSANAFELLLRPLAEGRLASHLDGTVRVRPPLADVQAVLTRLARHARPDVPAATPCCVVHGDLHADNVFALLPNESDGGIRGVALIDWGSVQDRRHPLSDIARLMADVAFRVRDQSDPADWAADIRFMQEIVRDWGQWLGCGEHDWKIALTHHLAKFMYYNAGERGSSFLTPEAREQAWKLIQTWARELLTRESAAARPRKRPAAPRGKSAAPARRRK